LIAFVGRLPGRKESIPSKIKKTFCAGGR